MQYIWNNKDKGGFPSGGEWVLWRAEEPYGDLLPVENYFKFTYNRKIVSKKTFQTIFFKKQIPKFHNFSQKNCISEILLTPSNET